MVGQRELWDLAVATVNRNGERLSPATVDGIVPPRPELSDRPGKDFPIRPTRRPRRRRPLATFITATSACRSPASDSTGSTTNPSSVCWGGLRWRPARRDADPPIRETPKGVISTHCDRFHTQSNKREALAVGNRSVRSTHVMPAPRRSPEGGNLCWCCRRRLVDHPSLCRCGQPHYCEGRPPNWDRPFDGPLAW